MPGPTEGVQPDLSAMLAQCCLGSVPVTAVFSDLGVVASCVFSGTTREDVTLLVESLTGAHALQDLRMALCLASFPYKNASWAFFSVVREQLGSAERPEQLKLAFPERLLRTERRSTFRVPVLESYGIRAALIDASDRSWQGALKDISLTGAGIAFPHEADPELMPGAQVRVRLAARTRSVELRAMVRHRQAGTYGLFFPDCLVKGEVAPPPDLRDLYVEAQQYWLKNRVAPRG